MRYLAILAIAGLLVASPTGVPLLSQPNAENSATEAAAARRYKTTHEVTLITGDIVVVGVTERGDYEVVGVRPFDPRKLDRKFAIFSTERGLYVVPSDVDLRVFDIELFNVRLLIEQINITGKRELRVIAQGLHAGQVRALLHSAAEKRIPARLVSRHLNMVSVALDMAAPRRINEVYAEVRRFKRVYLDRVLRLAGGSNDRVGPALWDSVPLIGADRVWDLDVTGAGVKIAILDTGIDSSHPVFLYPNGTSKVIKEVDFTDDYTPRDLHGHGTHVASIAAGLGIPGATTYVARGVAPDALLLNVKVLNRYGWGYVSWVIQGIEWAVENGADIISISLGGAPTDGEDPLSLAAEWAVSRGVVVVAAAGNMYTYFSIATPGAAKEVITVGATDKYDHIAWFSSRGPTLGYHVKPEVVAPGVDIWAALARGSLLEFYVYQGYLPGLDVDGDGVPDLVPLSGTSTSTPHVSGAVALIKQAKPHLTPQEVKSLLVSTAKPLGYDVYTQGGGRINVLASLTTGLLIHPAVVSLGLVRGGLVNFTVTFLNQEDRELVISLAPSLQRIFAGDNWNAVTLNVTLLHLPPGGAAAVLVTVNLTALPTGYYSGIIYTNYTIENIPLHSIFGFTKLYRLSAKFVDVDGVSPLQYIPVLVIRADPQAPDEILEYFGFTDSEGVVVFYLPEGTYYVIGLAYYSHDSYAFAWAIEKVHLTGDVELTLDLSRAHAVDYVPPVPRQVIAYLTSSLTVRVEPRYDGLLVQTITLIGYYPKISRILTTTHDLPFACGYTHYDRAYVHVPDPTTLFAPEVYRASLISVGVDRSIVVSLPREQYARIEREYRVAQTPTIAALIYSTHGLVIEWNSAFLIIHGSYSHWVITAPRTLTEYAAVVALQELLVSYMIEGYFKVSDMPGVTTPDFGYLLWIVIPELRGEHKLAINAHPLSPSIHLHVSPDGWLRVSSDVFSVEGFAASPYLIVDGRLATDRGRLVVRVNGVVVLDMYFQNYIFRDLNVVLPANIEVLLEGWSWMYLSSYAVTSISFTAVNGAHVDIYNPIVVQVLGLDLNNTHPGGLATVRVSTRYPITSIDLTYSFDGANWRPATLVSLSDYEALFSFPTTPGKRAALKVIAAFNVGQEVRVEYTVYDAFMVSPLAVYSLADFPAPFIDEFGDVSNTLILVGASDPRGPCDPAHTIDVAAGMYLAYALGRRAERGMPQIMMDWQAVNFNATHALRIFRPGNVIAIGGPGVNLVTWYYHYLTYMGVQQLPAYMAADAQGVYIYSPATGNKYRMVNDYGQGLPVTDYAMIVLHYDPIDSRHVLIVAGLSGHSSLEAGKWLAQYPELAGRAIILKFIDYEGDAIIDVTEIVEIIP